MSCESPLLALNLGINSDTGKMRIKFLPKRADYNFKYLEEKYGADNLVRIPCSRCASCILTYRKNWALRCELEAKCHICNCFVTLTYNDSNYPPEVAGINRKEDLQKFIHAVRDSGVPFRYFACGEYGTQSGRFHYHMIMFGYFPPDAKPIGKKLENMYFTSEFLSKKWNKGQVIVTQFEPGCAQYVAGYVSKKANDLSKQNFLMMSTRPGIAYDYFLSHKDEAIKYGFFVGDKGLLHYIPKYGNRVFDALGIDLSAFKDKNITEMRLYENDFMRLNGLHIREQAIYAKGAKNRDKLTKRRRRL